MPTPRIVLDLPNKCNAQGDFYWTGNPDGDIVFLQGSCRVNPYLNYLADLNTNYKIYCMHPYVYNEVQLDALEYNENLKEIFRNTKIFIKEYHANYGIFNTLDRHDKNIYQFGMKPEIDITIPAWNDHFVFVNDIKEWCKETDRDKIFEISQKNYDKFYVNCAKTDLPDFAEYFFDNFTNKRMNFNINHVTKNYSLEIFRMMNEKFLKIPITDSFLENVHVEHLAGNETQLTTLDKEFYGYTW